MQMTHTRAYGHEGRVRRVLTGIAILAIRPSRLAFWDLLKNFGLGGLVLFPFRVGATAILLERPKDWADLRADPALIPGAVAEGVIHVFEILPVQKQNGKLSIITPRT